MKLVIDCSGLLAQKGHSSDLIKNETQKKTIQIKLRRLAREEGDLNKNLSDLLLLLERLLSEQANVEDDEPMFSFPSIDVVATRSRMRNSLGSPEWREHGLLKLSGYSVGKT
ncbi:hypothetical protein [Enterovibrio norvegicus]|uniref:hypothetical protein n=1 Tax=Enterovibrio norvegicus TaxID=188144 RepID=UPI0011358A8B|nr:hypothetical protein [Enterovibrio norvegicus]TKF31283.1 hypothetical protein FCV83_16425 [Enterovibrio norvegicus]